MCLSNFNLTRRRYVEGRTCGKRGAKGRRLWKGRLGSPASAAAKARALFKTFGLDTHNDTLSVALVLQSSSSPSAAGGAAGAEGDGDGDGNGDGGDDGGGAAAVESVLYNAHWRDHLLADCAVTGESHVMGVNIELTPPESRARTALRSAAMKARSVHHSFTPSSRAK